MPKRGLGDATVQLLHDHARKKARVPLTDAARAVIETDELKPKPRAARCAGFWRSFDRWRKQRDGLPHHPARRDRARRVRLHRRDVAEGSLRRRRRPAGELERRLIRSMDEFENLQGFLEHISLVMDSATRRPPRPTRSNIMTLHAAKGLGAAHRVPARLGGRRVSQPARARRSGPRRSGRRASAPGMWASRAPAGGQGLFRHQPAHARPVADQYSVALPRRVAGTRKCGGHRGLQGGFGGYGGATAPRASTPRPRSARITLRQAGSAPWAKRDHDGFSDNADDEYEPDRGGADERGFISPLPCRGRPIERSSIG